MAFVFSERRSEDRSRLSAKSKTSLNEKKLTFAERVERMKVAVEQLREIVQWLEEEAAAMAQVQTRFEAKKPNGGAITG